MLDAALHTILVIDELARFDKVPLHLIESLSLSLIHI